MMNNETLLAEYTALRNELLSISSYQNTLFIFSLTSVGAVLALKNLEKFGKGLEMILVVWYD